MYCKVILLLHKSVRNNPQNSIPYVNTQMAGVTGIEPVPWESKSHVLPLHKTPMDKGAVVGWPVFLCASTYAFQRPIIRPPLLHIVERCLGVLLLVLAFPFTRVPKTHGGRSFCSNIVKIPASPTHKCRSFVVSKCALTTPIKGGRRSWTAA